MCWRQKCDVCVNGQCYKNSQLATSFHQTWRKDPLNIQCVRSYPECDCSIFKKKKKKSNKKKNLHFFLNNGTGQSLSSLFNTLLSLCPKMDVTHKDIHIYIEEIYFGD